MIFLIILSLFWVLLGYIWVAVWFVCDLGLLIETKKIHTIIGLSLLQQHNGANLDENLRTVLQTKAETAISRLCDEAIELLDSYWVKRDESKEAVAHYKCFKAAKEQAQPSLTCFFFLFSK